MGVDIKARIWEDILLMAVQVSRQVPTLSWRLIDIAIVLLNWFCPPICGTFVGLENRKCL